MSNLSIRPLTLAFSGAFLLFMCGCGGAPTASIEGKVSANGKPVTEGILVFSPKTEGASSAIIEVGSDGSYSGTTAIGENQVTYTAPGPKGAGEPDPTNADATVAAGKPSAFDGMSVKTSVITVASGTNAVDIELKR